MKLQPLLKHQRLRIRRMMPLLRLHQLHQLRRKHQRLKRRRMKLLLKLLPLNPLRRKHLRWKHQRLRRRKLRHPR